MDPLYILYTSGHHRPAEGRGAANAGHMVALAWTMRNIYAIEPGEVFWAASDVGWVVGHSYICYAPLLVGATTVVFEGKPVGHAGRRHLLAGDRGAPGQAASSPRRRRSGRSSARIPRASSSRDYDLSRAALPVPRRRAGRSRHHRLGAAARWGAGDRPLVADRDRLADRREPGRDRAAAGQARLADGADAGLRRADPVARAASRCRRASSARWRSGCRCRRARCRRSGTPTTRFVRAYLDDASPATTRPATPG